MSTDVRAWDAGETSPWLSCARHAGAGRAELIWATLAGEGKTCLFFCGTGAHYVKVHGMTLHPTYAIHAVQ